MLNKVHVSTGEPKELRSYKSVSASFEDLPELVTCCKSYSPIIFMEGKRVSSNFLYAELCVLDFDGNITLESAKSIFADFKAIIITTKSHQSSLKNGKAIEKQDRFRVLIPFDHPISELDKYIRVMKNITHTFDSDTSCADGARFFYPNPYQKVWVSGGSNLIEIDMYKSVLPKKGNTLRIMNLESINKSKNLDNLNDLSILAKDGREMKYKEWVETLCADETITVHCPNPAHSDVHPSAFITKSRIYSDALFIYCHVCGSLGIQKTNTSTNQEKYHGKI